MTDESATHEPNENEDPETSESSGTLESEVLEALRKVIDPELGLNIVDLGLIYEVRVDEGKASVDMTLTSPGCPAGPQILSSAQAAAGTVEGIHEAEVSLVWKPLWTQDRIDPAVRAVLGF
jgi:metal-sulfur cluster biosynthetic enzyme